MNETITVRAALEKIASGLTAHLADPNWKPRRAHIEMTRNQIVNALTAPKVDHVEKTAQIDREWLAGIIDPWAMKFDGYNTLAIQKRNEALSLADKIIGALGEQDRSPLPPAKLAEIGMNAPLPSHFQWGRDAMEAFAFVRLRATEAIIVALSQPQGTPPAEEVGVPAVADAIRRLQFLHEAGLSTEGKTDRRLRERNNRCLDLAIEALAAQRPAERAVREAARFLADRLGEVEWTSLEDAFREWAGHVEPALARLRVVLGAAAAAHQGMETAPDTSNLENGEG